MFALAIRLTPFATGLPKLLSFALSFAFVAVVIVALRIEP